MSKRFLIYCLAAAIALVAAIAAGVAYLYAGVSVPEQARTFVIDHRKAPVPAPVTAQSGEMEQPREINDDTATSQMEQPTETKREKTTSTKPGIVISQGPFSVKNCATGRMNSFSCDAATGISLKDENGKTLWTKPLDGGICGNAVTIDYYHNGKLQILFASGSSLYLVSRLGDYVKPFPVKLPGEVLLGPAVYDFNRTGKYNVIVLNKDNSIEMYNLRGERPDRWMGIKLSDTVLDLPILKEKSGKSYWIVNTASSTELYPFYGGERLGTYPAGTKPEDISI